MASNIIHAGTVQSRLPSDAAPLRTGPTLAFQLPSSPGGLFVPRDLPLVRNHSPTVRARYREGRAECCEENVRSYKTAHVPILAAEDGIGADLLHIDLTFHQKLTSQFLLLGSRNRSTRNRHLNRALLLHLCDIIPT